MRTLFSNVTALLMDERDTVLKEAYVAVESGKISFVGTQRPAGAFGREIDGRGRVLLPGLVNAHTHLPMTLLRGYGGGCDLHTWLNQYIFPAEERLDARAVRAGTALALAELIAAGVTCVADMYMFCEDIIQEVLAAGISANIARGATLFTDDFSFDTHPACADLRRLTEDWHGYDGGRILIDACVHGEYTSRPALWEAMAGYAGENKLGMHVHVSETRAEHEGCLSRHGKTPVEILDKYGVWNTRSIAAHCVWTTPEDWAIMAARGVSAVHNPASNLKLGSGIARVPAMRRAGVNVALGTDGVSSNNSHDMFGEMKLAALLPCGVGCDPLALSPGEALRMATADGARALGRNAGRVAAGCDADLILVDMERANLVPCHSPADNLVYSAHGCDVVLNMARGRVIYENGTFLTIDLERVRREVRDYAVPLILTNYSGT